MEWECYRMGMIKYRMGMIQNGNGWNGNDNLGNMNWVVKSMDHGAIILWFKWECALGSQKPERDFAAIKVIILKQSGSRLWLEIKIIWVIFGWKLIFLNWRWLCEYEVVDWRGKIFQWFNVFQCMTTALKLNWLHSSFCCGRVYRPSSITQTSGNCFEGG